MKSKKHSVAVVILTWNDWSNTIECLGSLFKNNYSNFDIILIDNNSEQFHYNKILDWCYKKKIHINFINKKRKISPFKLKKNNNLFIYKSSEVANFPFAKNLGITRGYNKGLNFSLKKNYDFIVRLDCDFVIPKNLIKGMVKTLIANPSSVAVSPKVYYHLKNKTKLIWWTNLNFTKNYFRFHRTGKNNNRRILDTGQFKGIITSDSICGCCVMIRTKSLKQAMRIHPPRKNILDEDFFYGPEDMELSHRLKKLGAIIVNLNYYAHHKVSQSIHVSGVKSNIYFATIGWLLITKKICNKKDQFITRIFFLLRAVLHFMKLFYKKDKDPHIGFLLGLKDYFLKY
jgi:GT2 family glycosyltransferase